MYAHMINSPAIISVILSQAVTDITLTRHGNGSVTAVSKGRTYVAGSQCEKERAGSGSAGASTLTQAHPNIGGGNSSRCC